MTVRALACGVWFVGIAALAAAQSGVSKATVPGIVFGAEGESHLRFSFSTSIETIEAGLESLRRNL